MQGLHSTQNQNQKQKSRTKAISILFSQTAKTLLDIKRNSSSQMTESHQDMCPLNLGKAIFSSSLLGMTALNLHSAQTYTAGFGLNYLYLCLFPCHGRRIFHVSHFLHRTNVCFIMHSYINTISLIPLALVDLTDFFGFICFFSRV